MPAPFTLNVYPNFDTASVYVEYQRRANTRGHGSVRYRYAGRDWIVGHPLLELPRDPDLSPSDPTPAVVATTIFGLRPDTPFELTVDFVLESWATGETLAKHSWTGIYRTRSDAFPGSSGQTKYIAPNGDNTLGNGTYSMPWKTPRFAADKDQINPGDTIVLKEGEYVFGTGTDEYTPQDMYIFATLSHDAESGTASAYITIRGETPEKVTIKGSRKLLAPDWEQVQLTGTYGKVWHSINSAGPPVVPYTLPLGVNRMRYKTSSTETGTILYPYMALSDSGVGEDTSWGIADHDWPGWFQLDDGSFYVKMNAGDGDEWGPKPPKQGDTAQLSVAAVNGQGLALRKVSYWKIEDIIFEDFGLQTTEGDPPTAVTHDPDVRYGVNISDGCHDIVVQRCTFRDCGVYNAAGDETLPATKFVTVQDCDFIGSGIWDVCDMRDDELAWQYGKKSPLTLMGIFLEVTRGMVIRRNSFDGQFYGISVGTDGNDVDLYDNSFANVSGDIITVDYPESDSAWEVRQVRMYFNESDLTNFGISFSPMNVGPVWCVANKLTEYVTYPFKPGNGDEVHPSAGWKLLYHNTCKSTIEQAQNEGSYGFAGNEVWGNLVAINNILQGTKVEVVYDISPNPHTGPNTFTRNVLYSTGTPPHQIWWRAIIYEKDPPSILSAQQALMDPATGEPHEHPDEQVLFNLNIEEVNPFPSGGAEELNAALVGLAVSIPGITNIAGTAQGEYLPEPLSPGQFGSFTLPPRVASATATLPTRLWPMLARQVATSAT